MEIFKTNIIPIILALSAAAPSLGADSKSKVKMTKEEQAMLESCRGENCSIFAGGKMDINTPLFSKYEIDGEGAKKAKPIYFQGGKVLKQKPSTGQYTELNHGTSEHQGMVQTGPRKGISLSSGDFGSFANQNGPSTASSKGNSWLPGKSGVENWKWFSLSNGGPDVKDPENRTVENFMKNVGQNVSVHIPVQNTENDKARNFKLFSDPSSGELVGKFIEEERNTDVQHTAKK